VILSGGIVRSLFKSLQAGRSMAERTPARGKTKHANRFVELNELTPHAGRLGLLLLDLAPSGCSGIGALIRFRQSCPDTPVLVVSPIDDHRHILAAFDAGATGYVRNCAAPFVLATAMQLVAAGRRDIPPQRIGTPPKRAIARGSDRRFPSEAPNGGLSERQVEVLHLAAKGLANKHIARELKVSENTVKVHLRSAYSKLGVCSRMQATLAATRLGIKL
jgi:two-component system, NarL family, response regulator LiaR